MRDSTVASQLLSYVDAHYFARRRTPKGIYAAFRGGSGAQVTAQLNEQAFQEVLLKPLAGVFKTDQDISTTVAGFKLQTPVILSSVGGLRGAHVDGELAATRAAAKFGAMQFVSGVTTTPIEEIVAAAEGPVFQQVYFVDSRQATGPMIERAVAAGVDGLVVVMDSAAPPPGRDRLPSQRHYIPSGVSFTEALRFLPQLWNRPGWVARFIRAGLRAPVAEHTTGPDGKPLPYFQSIPHLFRETPTFEDIPWIREYWSGPLVLKGIIRPDDARRAVAAGADAIVVSNHGGNMLDTTIPTLRALPAIVDAVGDEIDVLIDGGIRRGSDIVKAMALGAKAVGIGRAYVTPLMAAGEPGVIRAVELLRDQTINTLRLLGVNTPAEVDSSFLEFPPSWAGLTLEQVLAATRAAR